LSLLIDSIDLGVLLVRQALRFGFLNLARILRRTEIRLADF